MLGLPSRGSTFSLRRRLLGLAALSTAAIIGDTRVLEERLFEGLPTLDALEKRYLEQVLQLLGANRTRAAEVLGADRTLYRMAERLGLDRAERSDLGEG